MSVMSQIKSRSLLGYNTLEWQIFKNTEALSMLLARYICHTVYVRVVYMYELDIQLYHTYVPIYQGIDIILRVECTI